MLQNQTFSTTGNFPQPLLMNFTVPTKIQESTDEVPRYDEINQIIYDLRVVGTYSLKSHNSKNSSGGTVPDKKNEIDDQKNVK